MAAFAIGVALLLGVGGYLVWTTIIHTEGNLAKAAEAAYHAEKYTEAGADYHGLVNQFPNSDKHSYYQLMQQLCELRSHVGTPDPDIAACLDELDQFIDDHKEKDAALLKDRAADLAKTIGDLTKSFAEHNTKPADDAPLRTANRLEAALAKVTQLDAAVPAAGSAAAPSSKI